MSEDAEQNSTQNAKSLSQNTQLVHSGRDPKQQHGFVNSPIYRGSTVLFPTVEALQTNNQEYTYGRKGTPTVRNLERAIVQLEGGSACFLTPSGLSAVTTAIMALVEAGDHILVTDSVYQPTRRFCDALLAKLNVKTTYYDPLIGKDIAKLFRPNTKLVFTESPGSQTFEIQDIPAISAAAKKNNIYVLMDNTWATPLYFKAFEKGADISIQAATKYIVGHADAMLGAITVNEKTLPHVKTWFECFGLCAGPEDIFLGLRGMRTLAVRLKTHEIAALEMAKWLQMRPEVAHVLHPALANHPGHEIWARDFSGSSGLFSVVLKPVPFSAVTEMLESLQLFGMGWSWGGFESLAIPFHPQSYRTATQWPHEGTAIRFHIGLENIADLIADLEQGFAKLREIVNHS
ncbi:MAG: cystathionine beta-lyase [Pseudomonadota bacterium]